MWRYWAHHHEMADAVGVPRSVERCDEAEIRPAEECEALDPELPTHHLDVIGLVRDSVAREILQPVRSAPTAGRDRDEPSASGEPCEIRELVEQDEAPRPISYLVVPNAQIRFDFDEPMTDRSAEARHGAGL